MEKQSIFYTLYVGKKIRFSSLTPKLSFIDAKNKILVILFAVIGTNER